MGQHFSKHKILQTGGACLIAVFIIVFSSCEKVINPDLTNTAPIIVIEGSITDRPENQTVKISTTTSFDQPNTFNAVKGAKVTVSSSNNQTFNFSATTDGIYKSPRFRGIGGVTYVLQVVADGKTYTASSTMPKAIKPDSITFKKITIFNNSRIYPAIYYTDPAQVQNQYRYIVRINNKLAADLVTEDRFNNGNSTSEMITFEGDGVMKEDKVEIEMQCIDRNVFKYYFAANQTGGNNGPPVAPSNPDSNFDNGALGIFSAHTKTNHAVTLK